MKMFMLGAALLAAMLVSASTGTAAVTPRLYNGDFEIPYAGNEAIPDGYGSGGMGSMARVASGTDGVPAYSGSWLVRLTVPHGVPAAQVYSPRPFPLSKPGAYTLRVALRSGGEQAQASVGYAYLDAGWRPISWATPMRVKPPSGEWAVYSLPAVAPKDAAYVFVSVGNSLQPSPSSNSYLYVDALELVPASKSNR